MDHNIFVVVGIEFRHVFAFIIMCHDNVYVCARVGPCENETEFSDFAMKYFTAILFKLISPNGERTNISMTHKLLGKLTIFAVIKEAISINALITILENCVAENSIGIVVLMVPNQRNSLAIIVLKCVFLNDSAIPAKQIITSGPT